MVSCSALPYVIGDPSTMLHYVNYTAKHPTPPALSVAGQLYRVVRYRNAGAELETATTRGRHRILRPRANLTFWMCISKQVSTTHTNNPCISGGQAPPTSNRRRPNLKVTGPGTAYHPKHKIETKLTRRELIAGY